MTENWPPEVQSSAERFKQFIADYCGSSVGGHPGAGSPAGGDCTSAGSANICLLQGSNPHVAATGLEPGSPVVVTLAGPAVGVAGSYEGGGVAPGTPDPLVAGPDGHLPLPGAVSGIVIPAGFGQVTVTVTPRGGTPTTATFRR